jgi:hypothetical protein
MVARWVGWALVSAGLGAACAGRSTDGVDGEQGSGGTLAWRQRERRRKRRDG